MNDQNKKSDVQNILLGLLAIAVIIAFTYSFSKKFAEQEIAKLEEIKNQGQNDGKIANNKIDSALIQGTNISVKVGELQGQVYEQNKSVNRLENSLDKNFNELKIYKNEKNYIPDATADQQSVYLSKYKYAEY